MAVLLDWSGAATLTIRAPSGLGELRGALTRAAEALTPLRPLLQPLLHPQPLGHEAVAQALVRIIALALAAALLWVLWPGRLRGEDEPAGPRLDDRPPAAPLAAFLLTCALLLLNQVLVSVYVQRAHGGDPRFIAQHLGAGWFRLPRPDGAGEAWLCALIRWLGAVLPPAAADLLPYTVLRVQAALELPFVVSAYLAITGLLSPALSRVLWRSLLLPLALVAFTATFCLIEVRLWNPFTLSDLRWRWTACGAGVALWGVARLFGGPTRLPAPAGGARRLVLFATGGTALMAAVLLMYDVALLYNLGHLGRLGPALGACLLVALAAVTLDRWLALRVATPSASAGLAAVLAAFTALFFVPSLAIRYAGAEPHAAAAALLVAVVAVAAAAVQLARRRAVLASAGLIVALASAALAVAADHQGWLPLPPLPDALRVHEVRLLRAAALGLGAGGGAALLLDLLAALVRRLGPRP